MAIGDPNLDNVTSNPVTTNFGVPQGSVLGPILFTLFSLPLADICEENHLDAQFFADDEQMYIAFQPKQGTTAPQDSCIDTIAKCIQDTKIWMDFNLLKLNEEKTEFIILGNSQQLRKVCDPQLFLGEETIIPVTEVRNLGYYMDQFMRNDHHINTISGQCFGLLKNILTIRPYINTETCRTIVQALVISKLDYCNSLLDGTSANQLVKLQRVQNMACRVILHLRKYDCITSHLKDLHWLKVCERIRYKIATLMFNIKCKTAPMYLQELVKEKLYRRALRSTTSLSSVGQFDQPFGRTSQVFNSSFIISGPRIWNALLVELRMWNLLKHSKKD